MQPRLARSIRPGRCSKPWQSAWSCGDPGLQYDTTINRWHTCPNSGHNASNPCSEYMSWTIWPATCQHQPDEVPPRGRGLRRGAFQGGLPAGSIAQEILVDHASYPTKRIATNSHRFRPIGLGYSNLGSLLMSWGLPYDSDEARGIRGAITSILHGSACLASTELAPRSGRSTSREESRAHAPRHGDALGKGRGNGVSPSIFSTPRSRFGTRSGRMGSAQGFAMPRPRCLPPRGRSVS